MIDISNFLQKFLTLEKNNNQKIQNIIDVVKKVTNIDLSKEMIEISERKIKINCNPVFRNEIFMNKSEIEADLKSRKIFLDLV